MTTPAEPQLVVTADDMGYSKERDEGIIHCYRAGVISRASLMVNGASSHTAASMAQEAGLPIGLHLNLTEGSPISREEDIPSLLNHGYFHTKESIPVALAAGGINMDEVAAEIRAQINKFQELTGRLPLYVDGHQHVHVLPGVAEVFASILSRLDIRWTRLPVEDIDHAPWVQQHKSFFINTSSNAERAGKTFLDNGVRFTDAYFGMVTMGKNLSVERIQDALTRIFSLYPTNDDVITASSTQTGDVIRSCELMVHPGYACRSGVGGCGEGPDDFSQSEDREHEMAVLQDPRLLAFYEKHNFKLVPVPV